jgi:hypothetical protein
MNIELSSSLSPEPLLPSHLTAPERQLIEKLRRRPAMMERVQSILAIAEEAHGEMTADQVEGLLVEEMRKLGNTTLRDWAGEVQERLTASLRQRDATLRSRKKKH